MLKNSKLKKNSSPWVDGELLHLVHQKETLRQKAKNSGNPIHWDNYKKLSNQVRSLSRKKYANFLNDAHSDLGNNPKQFWKHVKIKKKMDLYQLKFLTMIKLIHYHKKKQKYSIVSFVLKTNILSKTLR